MRAHIDVAPGPRSPSADEHAKWRLAAAEGEFPRLTIGDRAQRAENRARSRRVSAAAPVVAIGALHPSTSPARRLEAQPSSDWEQIEVEAVNDPADEPLRRGQHDDDGDKAEDDEVPGSEPGEKPAQQEKKERSDDRTFDRPDPADHHHDD